MEQFLYQKFGIKKYYGGGTLGQSESPIGEDGKTKWLSGNKITGTKYQTSYWTNSVGQITSENPLYSDKSYILATRGSLFPSLEYYGLFLAEWKEEHLDKRDAWGCWPNEFSDGMIVNYRVVLDLPASCTFGPETGNQDTPISINWW